MPTIKRGVGFRLPRNSVSDAYNIEPLKQRINLGVEPFGTDGDTPKPNLGELMQQRYGRVPQTQPGVVLQPDVQGPHSSDNRSDLVDVRRLNPEWFGADWRDYDGVPTRAEVQDAHYTQNSGRGEALFREAVRLRRLEAPPPPPPPPVDAPPPPPGNPPPVVTPPPGNLSPVNQRVAELVALAHQVLDALPLPLVLRHAVILKRLVYAIAAKLGV